MDNTYSLEEDTVVAHHRGTVVLAVDTRDSLWLIVGIQAGGNSQGLADNNWTVGIEVCSGYCCAKSRLVGLVVLTKNSPALMEAR